MFVLFTGVVLGSFLFYDNETFAQEETTKSILNNSLSSFLQIPIEDYSTKTNNNSELVFSNVTNITNNQKNSVYAQIATNHKNDVYIIWQESVTEKPSEKNYDIFFIKSEDNGTTFSKPLNLSNNSGFSEHPQIALSKNGIFVVWGDNTDSKNTDVMFTKSEDNGTTFSKPLNLSNNSQYSNNQEISAFNENVYVVWQDTDPNNNQNSSIFFKRSIDSGNTFNDIAIELANNTNNAYPKVNSYEDFVYVVWNSENNVVWNSENNTLSKNNNNSGLFFIKSSDKGNKFENKIRVTQNNFGESQIAVNQSEIFIAWGGLHGKNIEDIYYVQSEDKGTTFTGPYVIQEKVTKTVQPSQNNANLTNKVIKYPTNVEIANDNPSYIVWQEKISKENQEIFIASNIPNNSKSFNIMNLSNNTGISECPQIAVSTNYVYVVWEDITPGNHEILFTRGLIQ
ncbi:MAG: sialidase family protein [Nitrososphaeraceae archaeon]